MRVRDIVRRSGRNLRQAKARTILTSLAIAVGAFVLTLTLAASNGAKDFVGGIIEDNFDPAELIVARDDSLFNGADTETPQEYDETFGGSLSNAGAPIQIKRLDSDDIKALRKIEGVQNVRLDIALNLAYITRPDQKKYVATIQVENPFQDIELLAGTRPERLTKRQILLPEGFLDVLGFSGAQEAVGKKLTLAVRKSVDPKQFAQDLALGKSPEQIEEAASKQAITEEEFTVVGVMKKPAVAQPGTELYLYGGEADLKNLQAISTKGTAEFEKYTSVYVRVQDGEDDAKLAAAQQKITEAGYASFSVEDTQKFLNQAINVLQGIVATFSLITVVAALFGVINTMYISVIQRTREIGLMKALGMRGVDVSRLFRFEAAWIGFLGGVIGSGLAVLAGSLLNPWITKTLELGTTELLQFDPKQLAGLLLGLILVAVVAGLFPARKAAKLDPIEALRNE